jgi:hypothetical protein
MFIKKLDNKFVVVDRYIIIGKFNSLSEAIEYIANNR